ncbi:MAG: ubiquinone/menaquinone biosynthesis methyltransferase [Anaerolineales bacterium]|nr:ubiquinone/menaquinone biosynthesis methyltransferase [Anaerolineales bacterium]
MSHLTGGERSQYVQTMFTRIARRYDLMNRVMTAGQDVRWRREVIRRAALPKGGRLLDLGAGTGDLAREALRQCAGCQPIAADFTLEMMLIGRRRLQNSPEEARKLAWSAADATRLPFPRASFEAVVSGFLLRNVNDLPGSLAEQYRVLRPGGRIVCLDTSPPPSGPLNPFIRFHLHTIIPTLGRVITGQAEAYRYLPDSTEAFLEPEQLAAQLIEAGFQEVGYQRRMFGTISIHWGTKPG